MLYIAIAALLVACLALFHTIWLENKLWFSPQDVIRKEND